MICAKEHWENDFCEFMRSWGFLWVIQSD
uniref:Uncharacterized protein n=1 Tax=Anguilla anguilla TaxID=7936 RepID=A0A0E9S0B7_ANGAN